MASWKSNNFWFIWLKCGSNGLIITTNWPRAESTCYFQLKKKIIEKEESLWDMKKIHNFLKLSQISLSPYMWAIKKKKITW